MSSWKDDAQLMGMPRLMSVPSMSREVAKSIASEQFQQQQQKVQRSREHELQQEQQQRQM